MPGYLTSLDELPARQDLARKVGQPWVAFVVGKGESARTPQLARSQPEKVLRFPFVWIAWDPGVSRSQVKVRSGWLVKGRVASGAWNSLPFSDALDLLEQKIQDGFSFQEPPGKSVVSSVSSYASKRGKAEFSQAAFEQALESEVQDLIVEAEPAADPYDRILRIDLDPNTGWWSAYDGTDLRRAKFILTLDGDGARSLYNERPDRSLKKKGQVVRYDLKPAP